jgi:hypothetical protein
MDILDNAHNRSKTKTIAWVEAKNKFGGGAMRELWLFLLVDFEILNKKKF